MMNLLVDPLPEMVTIEGRKWKFDPDFTNCIRLEQLMNDSGVPRRQKTAIALNLFYDELPDNLEKALGAIYDFYLAGGNTFNAPQKKGTATGKRVYDYQEDAPYIYSAFYADYGIDLQDYIQTGKTLHWWKFRSLFLSLSEDNLFCKIMGWRSADLRMFKGEERRFYRKMQKQYALPIARSEQDKLDEINRILLNGGDLQRAF